MNVPEPPASVKFPDNHLTLTMRQHFAFELVKEMIRKGEGLNTFTCPIKARLAVNLADELIKALNEEKEE